MRRPIPRALVVALSLALASPAALAARFVYEGRLDDAGQPANGRYDLKLTAYGHAAQGATLAAPVTFEGVEVRDGRFRLDVDLPLVKADEVWLEVAVRAAGEPAFAEIPGRAKAIAAPLIGACWSTTGDSGSNPATNFIGTTDAQAFVVRTQNVPSLRIEPSTILFGGNPITANVIAGSSANGVTAGVRGATISGGGMLSGDSDPDFDAEGPNRVTDAYGTVGGGYANRAGNDAGSNTDSASATVGGGVANTASGTVSTVDGGYLNTASGFGSTVGGGYLNTASGFGSTVGGGYLNTASGLRSAVGGGSRNIASAEHSTVGGGEDNLASEFVSTVGGGYQNRAGAPNSTVGGGVSNTAIGASSTVSGGLGNTASGYGGTVGGGQSNCAGGDLSWAGGFRAKVRPAVNPGGSGSCSGLTYPGGQGDAGTFVWADSQDANFVSTGSNQFLIRAAGGMAINTNAPATGAALTVNGATSLGGNVSVATSGSLSFGSQTRQMLNLWGSAAQYGIGVQAFTQYFRADAGGSFAWYAGGSHNDAQFNPGTGGSLLMTLTPGASSSSPTGVARAQTFVNVSDRAAKQAFEAVDVGAVLEGVLRLPVATWAYRNLPEVRHMGPVAQDFRAIFGLGEDERTIATVDADGVALAAIQGLHRKLEAERDALKAENAALRAESAELRSRLERLEALVAGRASEER